MNNVLIGIDFSLNKPSACVYWLNNYTFYFWPYDLSESNIDKLSSSRINIIKRFEERPKDLKSSERVRQDIINAENLSSLIITTLNPYLNSNVKIAFEGSSFSSKGNIVLQLTAYRYILMHKLSKIIPIDNIYTYAPITLKKTAGCSEKGKGKSDMIKSFTQLGPNSLLKENLIKGLLNKKKSSNYIDGVDDLVDSYWALQTLMNEL